MSGAEAVGGKLPAGYKTPSVRLAEVADASRILNVTVAEAGRLLREWLEARGESKYRLAQVLPRLWQRPVRAWADAKELPAPLRAALDAEWPLGALIRESFGHVDLVVSPAIGGIIPGYETARALGCKALFVEREDGEFQLRRSFERL